MLSLYDSCCGFVQPQGLHSKVACISPYVDMMMLSAATAICNIPHNNIHSRRHAGCSAAGPEILMGVVRAVQLLACMAASQEWYLRVEHCCTGALAQQSPHNLCSSSSSSGSKATVSDARLTPWLPDTTQDQVPTSVAL
jgi:hypothetical protein